jgi:hypothetical protein
MKKLTLVAAILSLGFITSIKAQTLLYQWAFTNATDTVSNSAPSYAFTPGTGALVLRNIAGNVFTAGVGTDGLNPVLYFTNSNNGPGSGPGVDALGALVANGQGYNGGNSAVAIATNLNLGNQFQVTMTCWFKMDASVASQFPRIAQFTRDSTFDIGNKGSGNHSDIGVSINNQAAGGISEQNSVASATGAQGTATSVNGLPGFSAGLPADNTTWIFEALTYNGTLATTNFITWLGTVSQSVNQIVYPANYGPIDFTTNACVMIGGDAVAGTARGLSLGAIADVRFYSGILTSNQVEQVRTFQNVTLVINPLAPASVIIQPVSGNNFVGGQRSFSVVAGGNPATFTYLWRSNGVPVAGATGPSLSLSNIQASANNASFVCSVSNAVGGTNSLPGILTVVALPANSYAAAVMAQNPFSFWEVNEPTNSTSFPIFDYANGHDGKALNPVNNRFIPGPSSPAYPGFSPGNSAIQSVQGIASQLNMANPVNFVNTGMTVCGWIYTPGSPNANGLMFDLVSDTLGGFGLTFSGANTVGYQWGANPPTSGFFGGTFNPGEWTFVALVISTNLIQADIDNFITADTNATIYVGAPSIGLLNAVDTTAINGDLIGSGTSASTFALGRVASAASDNSSFYAANNVAFNSVSIFYKALSSNSIANLYITGAGVSLTVIPDANTPGNLLLTYPLGTLQSAAVVTGPYTPVIGATSPWSVTPVGPQKFYRVSLP